MNQGSNDESDFYPYRYLANQGFLPGYNFPRLPLRAYVTGKDRSGRDESQIVDRPRFIGLSELGPGNIVYHEGRKHRVSTCVLPSGGLDARLTKAKLCTACGYIHHHEHWSADACHHCGEPLDDTGPLAMALALLDQPPVRTWRTERISADEEERTRLGYHMTTHYHFTPDTNRSQARCMSAGGDELFAISAARHATLWRINHGWRQQSKDRGFAMDASTGRWVSHPEEAEGEADDAEGTTLVRTGIKPYVTDIRNLLLLLPRLASPSEEALATLAYSLQRGLQLAYQVEEDELAVEVIGQGAQRRLLLWEAAEGGVGIWDRLIGEPAALAAVGRRALEVLHFGPHGGDVPGQPGCARACYECLLSYANQRQHHLLDRHAVSEFLAALAGSRTEPLAGSRPRDEHLQWLLERVDPASTYERAFVEHLHRHGLRLPDHAQTQPEAEVYAQPDFLYDRAPLRAVCVFLDGPSHDGERAGARDGASREALEDLGYKVIAIRHDSPLGEQIARHGDVFGNAVSRLT